MRIGLETAFGGPSVRPSHVAEIAGQAEQAGFHSLWLPEHVVLFPRYESQYPYRETINLDPDQVPLEPWTALAFIAARTERIRLGTGITLVPQRNPVYLAKQVADVDVLSGGRVNFGIGVGWAAEEFAALGVPWEHRGARTDEYLAVMNSLWTERVSSFQGAYYSLSEVVQNPKPVQKPHPPIYVGGETPVAFSRVARLGQGWLGFNYTPETLRPQLAKLDEALARRGRTRADIDVCICPYEHEADLDMIKRFRDLGVDEVVLMIIADEATVRERVDRAAEQIVAPAANL